MLTIDKESKTTLYEQIYNQLRDQIISGAVSEGEMLLSTRNLAKTLQVSRNTVESAYLQLYSEGYISSKACRGYSVEKIELNLLKRIGSLKAETAELFPDAHEQGHINEGRLNFQYGCLRASDFPLRVFRKLINQFLMSEDADLFTSYNDRKGQPELRREIAKYLYDSRGVKCRPEQIILCAGTISGIGLISQLLMRHTNDIAVEEPCYDSARAAFVNHGFRIHPIPVGSDGIDLGALECSSAKAVYVTPSHQFPTGIVMPVSRRLSLIEWASQNDAYIIEDDYDSELRYNSRPIPSMQSLDRRARVIYINTFSKSLAPGLRFSFLVLPQTILEEYQRYFNRYNCAVPLLEQKVVYAFMKEGYWYRHLRKINVSNKKRHDVLINAINEAMGDRVTIHGKNAGLHVILEVNSGLTEKELIERAGLAGVTVYPVSNYYADRRNDTGNKVLIGFSGLSEEEIVRGIGLLKKAWF